MVSVVRARVGGTISSTKYNTHHGLIPTTLVSFAAHFQNPSSLSTRTFELVVLSMVIGAKVPCWHAQPKGQNLTSRFGECTRLALAASAGDPPPRPPSHRCLGCACGVWR
eukprot:SAG22_NODE_1960_length_3248_cov_2.405208_5_plen_110_part_00